MDYLKDFKVGKLYILDELKADFFSTLAMPIISNLETFETLDSASAKDFPVLKLDVGDVVMIIKTSYAHQWDLVAMLKEDKLGLFVPKHFEDLVVFRIFN